MCNLCGMLEGHSNHDVVMKCIEIMQVYRKVYSALHGESDSGLYGLLLIAHTNAAVSPRNAHISLLPPSHSILIYLNCTNHALLVPGVALQSTSMHLCNPIFHHHFHHQPCRTTVFGAMNPKNMKGTYNSQDSVADNVSLSGPLLSRFDIILVLLDDKLPAWDELISSHILRGHQAAAGGKPSPHEVREKHLGGLPCR